MFRFLLPQLMFAEGDPPAGGGSGDPTPPAGETEPSKNEPPKTDPEVVKAYEKLREAEAQRNQLQRELKQIKDNQLPELDRIKQENESLTSQVTSLTGQIQDFAARGLAQSTGFKDTETAVAILKTRGVDLSTEEKAKAALTALAQEKPDLVGQPPPSGGAITPSSPREKVTTNEAMNREIRSRAGISVGG